MLSEQMADFNYDLPADRIAAFPLPDRDSSRMLHFRAGAIQDAAFTDLPGLMPHHSTLIFNDSKVIPARLLFQKSTGGVVEIFCLEPAGPVVMEHALGCTKEVEWYCLIGGASKWKPGQELEKRLTIGGAETILKASYSGKEEAQFRIRFSWEGGVPFASILQAAGAMPLPPYIKRAVTGEDAERYQTIFARPEGSVAAPTAALHFSKAVMEALRLKNIDTEYVTLHVGAGTFKPVQTDNISEHIMHAENFQVQRSTIEALLQANKIVTVGTTSLRTLESLYWIAIKIHEGIHELSLGQWEAYTLPHRDKTFREAMQLLLGHMEANNLSELSCRTALLIQPGYTIKSADALITNFHQPRSTLLLLVAAFIGPQWKEVYQHALDNGYRFLSYGDSSLLWRTPATND